MKYFLTLSCPVFLLFLAAPAMAKGWEEIFPLQTTRAEVFNLLGIPTIDLKDKTESFFVSNQTVTFSWTLADCAGDEAIIEEKLAKPGSLVHQITVVPDEALQSIDSYTADEPKIASPVPGFYLSLYVTHCIFNRIGQFSCSGINNLNGFGYSKSNDGFTSLYFFPTEEQIKERKENLKSCSAVEDKR